MHTECGLFGCVITTTLSKQLVYNAMENIQHRGQDSYGYITIGKNGKKKIVKHFGLLSEYDKFDYNDEESILFLGHMRYSTNTLIEQLPESSINNNKNNIQPIEISAEEHIYIAHNGNLPNLKENINTLGLDIEYIEGMSDTHLFKCIWNKLIPGRIVNKAVIVEFISYILENIPGAYSCVLSYYDKTNSKMYLFGFRDRYGYKPLSICLLDNNYCFVSETVQVKNSNDSRDCFINDVQPGEIWCIDNNGCNVIKSSDSGRVFICALEPIYFMKNESLLFNGIVSVENFRKHIGRELALQDIGNLLGNSSENMTKIRSRTILYIPESSYSIACGYGEILKCDVRKDLILKIENIRSFIESTHDARIGKLKRKFAFNIEDIKTLDEIVLIDDSIVRGNSMKFIVDTLYSINSNLKIHIRIGCPKLVNGCNFGIDLYDDELLALKTDNFAEYFKVKSVVFLDITRLNNIFSKYGYVRGGISNCSMCFGNIQSNNNKTLEW